MFRNVGNVEVRVLCGANLPAWMCAEFVAGWVSFMSKIDWGLR
jgi:hypothetical protein